MLYDEKLSSILSDCSRMLHQEETAHSRRQIS